MLTWTTLMFDIEFTSMQQQYLDRLLVLLDVQLKADSVQPEKKDINA